MSDHSYEDADQERLHEDLEEEEGIDDDEYESDDDDYREELDLEDALGLDESEEEEEEEQRAAEYIRGLGPLPQRPQGGNRNEESSNRTKSWQGLESLPEATRSKYVSLLQRLKAAEKSELTVLLIGKHCTGKSHTVNSLLNEEAAKKQSINRDPTPPTIHTREAQGLKLNVIDTGSPTELDFFSVARIQEIAKKIEGRKIDAVLYVDRLDNFRTDGADQQIIEGFTNHLGSSIWNNTILCFTRAASSIDGFSFDSFVETRSSKLREAIQKFGRNKSAALPAALIENSDTCKQNSEGEHILPNDKAWLPELMERIVEVAETHKPYQYDKAAVEKTANPNKKLRWAVPLIFVAQLAIKKFVLDPILKDDYNTGDKNGPFEPNVIKGRRAIAKLEKQGQVRKGSSKRQPSRSRKMQLYDSDSD